jgi:protein-S-isoprenylcysteine O-methyltransferase Ste14
MGIDPAERTSLVVAGPFAYVRHPIYALSQLMMLASVVAVPSYVMIAVGVMHIVLLQWEVRREEAHMLQVHGAAYTDYCARVGRFIPHRAAVPEVG